MGGPTKRFYGFDPFRIDIAKRLLLRDGEVVPLIAKAFDLLVVLVENRERVVEKDELMKRLWPESIVEESNLTQNVFVLRKALGEGPAEHRYIVTVPRRGYHFVASVREVWEEEAEPAQYRARAIIESRPVQSVAVLPFKPLRPGGEDEYLGWGLTDALITRLSNVREIITRPTSAVLKYAVQAADPLSVGGELGVDALIEGHVQVSQDRLRVTVQLVRVPDGAPLWAEKFDAPFTDIFTVQDAISEQLTRALMLKLTTTERQRLTKHHTENIEAYQLYLKGRYFVAQWTLEQIKRGIECFNRAITLDPNFALAFAGLADAWFQAATLHLSPKEALPAMKEAARKAVERDDLLAEGHSMLAAAKMNLDWDWAGAETEFKRALELNPGLAAAHHWYGWYLVLMGRHDESIAELQQALQLDPLSLGVNLFLASAYFFARRYEEGEAQGRKIIEMEPNYWAAHWGKGASCLRKEQVPEALAALDQARSLSDSPIIAATAGWCYALAGQKREARQVFNEMQQLAGQRFVSPYYLALICAALKETDEAFTWLARACAERDESAPLLKVDPRVDSLRSDPRFADLLRRIRLAS